MRLHAGNVTLFADRRSTLAQPTHLKQPPNMLQKTAGAAVVCAPSGLGDPNPEPEVREIYGLNACTDQFRVQNPSNRFLGVSSALPDASLVKIDHRSTQFGAMFDG